MGYWIQEQNRLLKSVRIIKAYYESKLESPIELLKDAPVEPREGDIPFSGTVTAFMWGLRPSEPVSKAVYTEIAEMCKSLLGGLDELETKRQQLERMQLHLERALNGTTPDNVISLRRRPSLTARMNASGAGTERRMLLKRDCLIEGKSVDEIHKMALELHAQGSRLAFLNFHDLEIHQRHSISQLLGLGSITLFIPDILLLNSYEQEILRHVLLQDSPNRPLMMAGTTLSYSDLRADGRIESELLVLLSRAYIKLTRPFSEYKEQGLIHYFLDSLSESPT